MRESFVFYRSFYESLLGMSPENQGDCLMAVANYALNGEEPKTLTPEVRMFFTLVKPQIDANNQRFENGCKGAEYGKLGGRPKKHQDCEKQTPNTENKNPEITPKKPQENPKQTPNVNVNDNVNVLKEKINKKEKISFLDVFDWKSLFTYWEENKKGGKYKNDESRARMLAKLKELTHNDLEFAKAAICHAIDNNYQGFCNGNELFYKPPKTKQGAYEGLYAECVKNGNEFLESFNNG